MLLSDNAKGLIASLAASFLFGLLYYYATLLAPLRGTDIYGWRVIATIPFLTLFVLASGTWPMVRQILARLRREPRLFALLPLSSALLGVQYWLFLWAPVNGRALQVSLGYLLMPLVMVLFGRVLYKERLLPFQQIAVVCAAVGVGNQVLAVGAVSWEVLVVAFGFPAYFCLRRWLGTGSLGGLWIDFIIMFPVAVGLTVDGGTVSVVAPQPRMWLMIVGLGLGSAVSVACYILASRFLSLSLFGLLSYVEPVLLVMVSLLLGERISSQESVTYLGVGMAVAVLALGGVRQARLVERKR